MKRHITSMKCYFWEKHHLDFCENTAPETIVAFFRERGWILHKKCDMIIKECFEIPVTDFV